MAAGNAAALEAAIDGVFARYDQVLQLVEDGALDEVTEARFVDYLQRLDQVQNRLRFLERQVIARVERRSLPAAG